MLAPVSITMGTMSGVNDVIEFWYVAWKAASRINFSLLSRAVLLVMVGYVVAKRGGVG